ncbi:shikimate kinase [Roseovarius sp. S4756]|uniref:shikimate kinase n=1 Tax=Roseovarius maritimus TaxID=3342637 RepID=UPI00372AA206
MIEPHDQRAPASAPLESPVIVFVVGPSGVGKSTIVRTFFKTAGLRFKYTSLDNIAAQYGQRRGLIETARAQDLLKTLGAEAFFLAGMSALFQQVGASNPKRIHVVDVGAGFQNALSMKYMSALHPMIYIHASYKVAYERFFEHRNQGRTFEMHIEHEFSPTRNAIYRSASSRIETDTLSVEDAAAQFGSIIRKLVD